MLIELAFIFRRILGKSCFGGADSLLLEDFSGSQNLVDISAPNKKILTPPPPPKFPNSPQTLPAPRPLPSWRPPPLPGIFNEKPIPPPSRRLGVPLPPPRAEKNKNYPKRPPRLGNAVLFTIFLFTTFVPLKPPPPNQQNDGFPLEFLLEGPQTELRTLSQNCEQTLQKLRTNRITNLEAQQRYFSFRAIPVAIVSQNSFVLVFVGYRTTIARYVAKCGIAQMCLCETKCQGGIAPFWGSANLP